MKIGERRKEKVTRYANVCVEEGNMKKENRRKTPVGKNGRKEKRGRGGEKGSGRLELKVGGREIKTGERAREKTRRL